MALTEFGECIELKDPDDLTEFGHAAAQLVRRAEDRARYEGADAIYDPKFWREGTRLYYSMSLNLKGREPARFAGRDEELAAMAGWIAAGRPEGAAVRG
jgi:hypothetical protein